MHVVQPRERRDQCREACCGPPDRPRGILGCPFCLMVAAVMVGGRPPGRPAATIDPMANPSKWSANPSAQPKA